MPNLTPRDKVKIVKLGNQFPEKIHVKIIRSEDGGFSAEILTFPGCFTEGHTFSELMAMINDAVRTYFEIPEKYISFMPEYQPSLDSVKSIGVFPITKKVADVNLKLSKREEAKS